MIAALVVATCDVLLNLKKQKSTMSWSENTAARPACTHACTYAHINVVRGGKPKNNAPGFILLDAQWHNNKEAKKENPTVN